MNDVTALDLAENRPARIGDDAQIACVELVLRGDLVTEDLDVDGGRPLPHLREHRIEHEAVGEDREQALVVELAHGAFLAHRADESDSAVATVDGRRYAWKAMRLAATPLSDPALWLVGASAGLVPARGEVAPTDAGSTTLLVLLSAAAMLIASLVLGFARRRVVEVLAAWAEAGAAPPPGTSAAAAPRGGD